MELLKALTGDVAIGLLLVGTLVWMLMRRNSQRLDPNEVPKILEEAERHVREGRQDAAIELLELASKHHVNHPKLSERLKQLREPQG